MEAKKLIAWVIVSAIAVSTAACGNSDNLPPPRLDDDSSESTEPTVTGRDAISDDLPVKDYGGTDFVILGRTDYSYEFETEEETGDLMNDAIFRRNRKVSERFNVNIKLYTMDCSWGDQATQFNNTLRASVMAGDKAFDLVAGYAATIPELVSDKIFYNWADLNYVDFSKPWWSQLVADEFTINDKMYMVTGDISLVLWEEMDAIFFNKVLAEDYHVDDLYQMVQNGKWTLDALNSISKDIYKDLDNDGTHSEGDTYGFVCGRSVEIDNFLEAFEIRVAKKGSDGFPEITLMNEHTIDAVQRVNALIHENDGVYFVPSSDKDSVPYNSFFEGRALFFPTTLGKSQELRAMDNDFGILPYPKYDENQQQYHSTSTDAFSLFLIPEDAKDPEMTAIITEALCAESYKKVIPTFYDIALKTKGARDDDSSEMIDLIRDSLTFDFGYLHSNALGGVGHRFVNWIRENNNNVKSDFEAKKNLYNENLTKVLEVYR